MSGRESRKEGRKEACWCVWKGERGAFVCDQNGLRWIHVLVNRQLSGHYTHWRIRPAHYCYPSAGSNTSAHAWPREHARNNHTHRYIIYVNISANISLSLNSFSLLTQPYSYFFFCIVMHFDARMRTHTYTHTYAHTIPIELHVPPTHSFFITKV